MSQLVALGRLCKGIGRPLTRKLSAWAWKESPEPEQQASKPEKLPRRPLRFVTDGSLRYGQEGRGGFALLCSDPRFSYWGNLKLETPTNNSTVVELAAVHKVLKIVTKNLSRTLRRKWRKRGVAIFTDCMTVSLKLDRGRVLAQAELDREWLGPYNYLYTEAVELLQHLEKIGIGVEMKYADTKSDEHLTVHNLSRAATRCRTQSFSLQDPVNLERIRKYKLPSMGIEPRNISFAQLQRPLPFTYQHKAAQSTTPAVKMPEKNALPPLSNSKTPKPVTLTFVTDGSLRGKTSGMGILCSDSEYNYWGNVKLKTKTSHSAVTELLALSKVFKIVSKFPTACKARGVAVHTDCDASISKLNKNRYRSKDQLDRKWLSSDNYVFIEAVELLQHLDKSGIKVEVKRADTKSDEHLTVHQMSRAAAGYSRKAFSLDNPDNFGRLNKYQLPDMGIEPGEKKNDGRPRPAGSTPLVHMKRIEPVKSSSETMRHASPVQAQPEAQPEVLPPSKLVRQDVSSCVGTPKPEPEVPLTFVTGGSLRYDEAGRAGIAMLCSNPLLSYWGRIKLNTTTSNPVGVELAAIHKVLGTVAKLPEVYSGRRVTILTYGDEFGRELEKIRRKSDRQLDRSWLARYNGLFIETVKLLQHLDKAGAKVEVKRASTTSDQHVTVRQLSRAAAGCVKEAFSLHGAENLVRLKKYQLPNMGIEPRVESDKRLARQMPFIYVKGWDPQEIWAKERTKPASQHLNNL